MSKNIRINEIPSGERPREKLLFYGAQFLSNEELLAIILRTGNKDSNVVELSYRNGLVDYRRGTTFWCETQGTFEGIANEC